MPPERLRGVPSAKLRAYLALTAAGTIAGLTLGRPELVALVAPFAVYVAAGAVWGRPPRLALGVPVLTARVQEGEPVLVDVGLEAEGDVEQLDLRLRPHRGLAAGIVPAAGSGPAWGTGRRARGGSATHSADAARGTMVRVAVRLEAGERRELRFALRAQAWGAMPAGALGGVARDRFGLIDHHLATRRLATVRVYPRRETLVRMLDPMELKATAGSRVAPNRGEGIEFAEVRRFAPGDLVRRVNWRVSARRGTLFVSDRHPERSADVILFLDAFSDVGPAGSSTLVSAVRAAASLATAYLDRKDRVGVIGFGGVLSGLGPRLGVAQLYRIVDALIQSEAMVSYVDKDVSFVPRRLLPAKALLVAITPLVDERFVAALFDLRRRGFDLAIVDISPVPMTSRGRGRGDELAYRLWRMHRAAVAAQFERLGVAIIEWHEGQPLQVPVAGLSEMRRHARRQVAR